jgi:very-short-patch-repair endonuclease
MTRPQELRRNSTNAERKLWSILRNRALQSFKFRRQQPLGPFIVDFVCLERRLILEVDGGQHAEEASRDAQRTKWLEEQNFRVLRFWNNDVLGNPEGVAQQIAEALKRNPSPGR